MATVYTVGHSNHSIERFITLLNQNKVTAIADVRSTPYSRFHPQFNRESLKAALARNLLAYVFLGKELGARPQDLDCYKDGKVQYERLAKTESFLSGIQRIRKGIETHSIVLMCSEKDPITCHRTVLIARHLSLLGIEIQHILENGSIESHESVTRRILAKHGWQQDDFFRNAEDAIDEAFALQGAAIAFQDPDMIGERGVS